MLSRGSGTMMRMLSMTTYKQGDVLLVPFPFTNQYTTKKRPAVVVSGEQYNRDYQDVILAPITSKLTGKPDEVVLKNWKSAGLLKSSAVKPVLSTLENNLILRQLGALSDKDLKVVKSSFKKILELK